MASPHADSFYCLLQSEFSNAQLLVYNSLCVASSLFGLAGAGHQIRTWRGRARDASENEPSTSQPRGGLSRNGQDGFINPHIVVGLAKADFAACVGKSNPKQWRNECGDSTSMPNVSGLASESQCCVGEHFL